MIKKNRILVFFFSVIAGISSAQENDTLQNDPKEKVKSVGILLKSSWTTFSSVLVRPLDIYGRYPTNTSINTDPEYIGIGDKFSLTVVGYNYGINANFVALGTNSSLSLNVSPGASIGFYSGYLMGVEAPMFLAFNHGLGSTFTTEKENGFGIGIGMYSSYYFGGLSNAPEATGYKVILKDQAWIAPAIEISIRSWNIRKKTNEYKLKEHTITIAGRMYDYREYSPYSVTYKEKGIPNEKLAFMISYKSTIFSNY